MKTTLSLSLFAFFCFACGQNNSPEVKQTTMPPTLPVQDTTAMTANDSTYIISDFLADLKKTRSPYTVSKTADYLLFGFFFTPKLFNGYTVHEGGYDTELHFDPQTAKYTGKEISGLEAFEFIVDRDATIRLTFLKSKKTYTYLKTRDADFAVREAIFEGNYTDTKTKTPVVFKADGTVTGLGSAKTYLPFYDFMGGPLDFDEMAVEQADASTVYYHYKFKGQTLELYEAIQPKNGDGVEKIGGLKYTLVKN